MSDNRWEYRIRLKDKGWSYWQKCTAEQASKMHQNPDLIAEFRLTEESRLHEQMKPIGGPMATMATFNVEALNAARRLGFIEGMRIAASIAEDEYYGHEGADAILKSIEQ